jgi:hypothetical protein
MTRTNDLGKTCQLRVYEKREFKGIEQYGGSYRQYDSTVNKPTTRHQQDIDTFSACQIDDSTQLKRASVKHFASHATNRATTPGLVLITISILRSFISSSNAGDCLFIRFVSVVGQKGIVP